MIEDKITEELECKEAELAFRSLKVQRLTKEIAELKRSLEKYKRPVRCMGTDYLVIGFDTNHLDVGEILSHESMQYNGSAIIKILDGPTYRKGVYYYSYTQINKEAAVECYKPGSVWIREKFLKDHV